MQFHRKKKKKKKEVQKVGGHCLQITCRSRDWHHESKNICGSCPHSRPLFTAEAEIGMDVDDRPDVAQRQWARARKGVKVEAFAALEGNWLVVHGAERSGPRSARSLAEFAILKQNRIRPNLAKVVSWIPLPLTLESKDGSEGSERSNYERLIFSSCGTTDCFETPIRAQLYLLPALSACWPNQPFQVILKQWI